MQRFENAREAALGLRPDDPGRDLALPQILAELGHVAEGVLSAPTVLQRARSLGVAMPITEAVVGVLQGRVTPAEALAALMGREARPEH